jgi:MFS family permease
MTGKAANIALLALCEVLAMSLWFAASAVAPQLKALYQLDGLHQAALASGVALGFVLGTLSSALLGLADRIDPRRLFCAAAVLGAAANAGMLAVDPAGSTAIVLRLVVGISAAGLYPVGMKLAATWADADMGMLVGILVAALVLGSASSFLVGGFGGLDWQIPVLASSLAALLAGILILFLRLGPRLARAAPFRPATALHALRDPALRLANFGYFGHMWELYAMWAGIGVFLDASFRAADPALAGTAWARLATFAVIGVGAVGSLLGGLLADRWGRTLLTIGAMLSSGLCAVLAGLVFGANPILVVALCLVWGVTVVADSAQFSASVMELAEPSVIGTMVTAQTCIGFLLTIVSIHLLPPMIELVGWRFAFTLLAAGPLLGALAMLRLRRLPEAARLAGGRR